MKSSSLKTAPAISNQKRIRKASLIHFAATVFWILIGLTPAIIPRLQGIEGFWPIVFVCLQPHFLILALTDSDCVAGSLLPLVGCLLVTPVWSFCFGWIFIRLKDWLNRFPILGRRVF